MDSGNIYFAEERNACVIKFVGDIRYTSGCSFDDFLTQKLSNAHLDNVFIDLSETNSIDSTSLGLLAKIANIMRSRDKDQVTIVAPTADVREILVSMGFDEIFAFCDRQDNCKGALTQLVIAAPGKHRLNETVIEAHTILSELNNTNRQAFAGVLKVLNGKSK